MQDSVGKRIPKPKISLNYHKQYCQQRRSKLEIDAAIELEQREEQKLEKRGRVEVGNCIS